MYRLTPRRLQKAEPILEKYREKLYRLCHIESVALEVELRKCWNIGYQELKHIMEGLLRLERYRYLALYYMQNHNVCVVTEFWAPLAKAYGSRKYDAEDTQKNRKKFWDNFNNQIRSGALK